MKIAHLGAVLLFLCSPASAQGPGKGSITGRVVDVQEHAIVRAHVRAVTEQGSDAIEVETDETGAFRLELEPGRYRLEFEADGYASASLKEQIEVKPGRETRVKRKIELPDADQGSVIRGSVFTEEGRSLPGAEILVERISGDDGAAVESFKGKAVSDRSGIFAVKVPKGEGRYRVTASREGFTTQARTIDASGGEIINVALQLPLISRP